VTDATLAAGRLPARLLGGEIPLDETRARAALATLGLADPAAGVLRVANAALASAVRLLTVARGVDPRPFTLLAFGGAGPLHACDVADELGIERVLVPPAAGLLCAWGALCADVVHETARSVMRTLPCDLDDAALVARAAALLAAEGIPEPRRRVERVADLRYRGQSFEIEVPLGADLEARVHRAHRERYGYAMQDRAIEVVALRVRAAGTVEPPPAARGAEAAGTRVSGPATLADYGATTYVPSGWAGEFDDRGNLRLRRA
jgi:N-methylhydantoinase A